MRTCNQQRDGSVCMLPVNHHGAHVGYVQAFATTAPPLYAWDERNGGPAIYVGWFIMHAGGLMASANALTVTPENVDGLAEAALRG